MAGVEDTHRRLTAIQIQVGVSKQLFKNFCYYKHKKFAESVPVELIIPWSNIIFLLQ